VRPKEASGFSTGTGLIVVFVLGFLFVCGAFIWLLIVCRQHEQTWGRIVRILVSHWCFHALFCWGSVGWPSVSSRHRELISGGLLGEAFMRSYGACKENFTIAFATKLLFSLV
jgi:hypothetical protein